MAFYVNLTGFDLTYGVQLVNPRSDSVLVVVLCWIQLHDMF